MSTFHQHPRFVFTYDQNSFIIFFRILSSLGISYIGCIRVPDILYNFSDPVENYSAGAENSTYIQVICVCVCMYV